MKSLDKLINKKSGDANDLVSFVNDAVVFVTSFMWCKRVNHIYKGKCWDGILGIFLLEIDKSSLNADDTVWVIVGDIPPAYLDIISCPNRKEVLTAYIELMEEWVAAIKNGGSVEDLMPVYYRGSLRTIPATMQYADILMIFVWLPSTK